jgi:putative hydrolases of HD superfamily
MDKTLEFLHLVHQMKRIERFKDMPFWKNTQVKRWDSDAEHSYRVALIAMIIQPFLKKKYNFEKLLKMILLHDLVEILINDKFPFKKLNGKYSLPKDFIPDKPESEIIAFNKICSTLSNKQKKEYQILFKEFLKAEAGKNCTNEAKLAVALDRIESSLQVTDYMKLNEFEISKEHKIIQTKYLNSKSDIDEPFIINLVKSIGKEINQ